MGFKSVPESVKNTILKQIKTDGRSVADTAQEFKISSKTIYTWLRNEVDESGISSSQHMAKIHRLEKEKQDLIQIIGALSVVVERMKKKTKRIILARNIIEENPDCNVKLLTKVLNVSRSLLYYNSLMDLKDENLRNDIESVNKQHPYYGHRRIAWTLEWGLEKSRRIMKKFGIIAKTRKTKRFIKKDDIGLEELDIPNLTKDLIISKPNHVWRTDFTYLKYKGAFFYLATVLDDFTKEIVGYSIGINHTKEFVLLALKDAIRKTGIIPLIFHSDQGSEYRSYLVLEYLTKNNIQVSMSPKGQPWKNGSQESYFGKFKLEIGNLNDYDTFEQAIEAIHHQIYYYNNLRMHTTLRMSPISFRKKFELNSIVSYPERNVKICT